MQTRPASVSTKVVLLTAGIFLFAFFILPGDAINYEKIKARVVGCRSNLRQVGIAVQSYQASHGGRMPPMLRSLLPITGSKSVFVCPASGYRDGTEVSYNYRFLSKPNRMDIICWDSQPHYPAHTVLVFLNDLNRNVLLADGQVKSVPEAEFQRLHLQGQKWIIR